MRIASLVLDDVARWSKIGLPPRVAINFDAHVIEAPGVVHTLMEELQRRAIPSSAICVELTETTLPRNMAGLIEALTRLRMAGFHLSIDDYGTGGANFEILRLCPFSELKMDRSIVQAAVTEELAKGFLNTAVRLARNLDLTVVAEGVETDEELELVKAAGVDSVQGFLFSHPYPFEDIVRTMKLQEELRDARPAAPFKAA